MAGLWEGDHQQCFCLLTQPKIIVCWASIFLLYVSSFFLGLNNCWLVVRWVLVDWQTDLWQANQSLTKLIHIIVIIIISSLNHHHMINATVAKQNNSCIVFSSNKYLRVICHRFCWQGCLANVIMGWGSIQAFFLPQGVKINCEEWVWEWKWVWKVKVDMESECECEKWKWEWKVKVNVYMES